jgi:hypothetical protein
LLRFQVLETYSTQSLAKISKVSQHFQSFADDDMVLTTGRGLANPPPSDGH